MSWSEGNVTSDRISMGASPLTGHSFDKLVAYLPWQFLSSFQLVFSVRFPGGVHAASPLTSSSNSHDDELGCHRLAAGGGFGRPARYFVHHIYSEDLHQQHTQTGTPTHTSHTETRLNLLGHTHIQRPKYTRTQIHTHRDPHTTSTHST